MSAPIRALPHNLEAEEMLLSCCFVDQEVVSQCLSSGLTPDAFYDPKHSLVFDVMMGLIADQKPVTVEVLAAEMQTRKVIDQVGGWAFFSQISNAAATTGQTAAFLATVLELAQLRALIRHATGLVEECYDFTGDFDTIRRRIERIGLALTTKGTVRTWAEAVAEAETITRERMKPPQERSMGAFELSWGNTDFDRYFQPLEPGELVVIGGYTSSGKSSLLRNTLWAVAKAGHPSLISTFEVRDTEEAINLAGHIAGIRSRARLHELSDGDKNMILDSFSAMRIGRLEVCHEDCNLAGIVARAKAFKRKNGLRVLGVDYLQILEDVKKLRPNERPDFAISCVTSELKRFATNEKIVVFLLSGFNRDYIRAGDREPRLSDLDGSSAIEKDASRVLLLHVPADYTLGTVKYSQSATADASDQPRLFTKVIQAKGRNTGNSSVGLMFHRETKTFHQIAK